MTPRILLVEDNTMNRLATQSLLEKLGYQVLGVRDGGEAVEAYAGGEFDAILMDCQMPGMDGFEATARIRRRQVESAHDRTPIIGLSGRCLRSDRDVAIALGMDAYLTKPVNIKDLVSALREWTSKDARGPVERPKDLAAL